MSFFISYIFKRPRNRGGFYQSLYHANNATHDKQLANAHLKFPIQPPTSKEEFYYRSIFTEHFPSDAAAKSVPSVPSVACSTPTALEWDESFKNMNDPSGRAVANIHNEAY